MAVFEWTPEYSVSVQQFDSDHQKLIFLINQLSDALRDRQERPTVTRILHELSEYTRSHFEAEEIAMRRAGYPGLEQHIAEHRVLTGRLMTYFAEYDAKSAGIAVDLRSFLRDWLQNHILVCDRQYTAALNGAGIN